MVMKRHFAALLSALCLACDAGHTTAPNKLPDVGPAALVAEPKASTTTTVAAGEYALPVLGDVTAARLIIPASAAGKCNVPLIVMLHGGFGPSPQLQTIINAADSNGVAVMLPFSKGITWDMVLTGFGDDVRNIDRALDQTMSKVCVNKNKIALAGFSDGASSALMLGIPNGQLFTHIMAFSSGILLDVGQRGKPLIYISHGRGDGVLPFANVENLFVPYLEKSGYSVTFTPFTGGHTIPLDVAAGALTWFLR